MTIARAMLIDSNMLILDEATSNLDTGTEIEVNEAMQQLMHGKTCFVIAHRLSTIRNADNILVISGGRLAEQGTHDALLEKNGVYAELYASQFVIADFLSLIRTERKIRKTHIAQHMCFFLSKQGTRAQSRRVSAYAIVVL